MALTLFILVVSFIFVYLESKKIFKYGLKLGFLILTIFQAIHYDFGTDYMNYYDLYITITSTPYNFNDVISGEIYKDPGWCLLNYFFQPIGGFFGLVAFISIFQNLTIYKLIVSNTDKEHYYFSFFIYAFTSGFYLLSMSMLRQSFAVSIFVLAYMLAKNKKILFAFVLTLIASLIHKSASLMVPFVFWNYLDNIKIKKDLFKYIGLILTFMFFVLWINSDWVNIFLSPFIGIDELEDYFRVYGSSAGIDLGFGFALNSIPFFLICYTLYFYEDPSRKSIFAFAAIGMLMITFATKIPIIGRQALYFNIFTVCVLPSVFSLIKKYILRISFYSIFIFMTVYQLYLFFTSGSMCKSYMVYHTIFDVL